MTQRNQRSVGGVAAGTVVLTRRVVVAERLVVPIPKNNRRVVPELVDKCRSLPHRLRSYGSRMTPLKRKILEDEHPELVRLFVEVRVTDMAVDSH